MLFSIVIPFYNAERYLANSIESVLLQKCNSSYCYEVIAIDDSSTDSSYEVAQQYMKYSHFKLVTTELNSGPGAARNIGINNASGEYILFLDSDDFLVKGALDQLYQHLVIHDLSQDLVAYNWAYSFDSDLDSVAYKGGRRDIDSLFSEEESIAENYLGMKMDGSVIYTLVKKKIIDENNIKFRTGIHEDIDFAFKLYYFSEQITYLDSQIYMKRNHSESIVNTISEKHLSGYMEAWREMFDFIADRSSGVILEKHIKCFKSGLSGAIGTLIVAICRRNSSSNLMDLYSALYKQLQVYFPVDNFQIKALVYPLPEITPYDQLSSCFISVMEGSYDEQTKLKLLEDSYNTYNSGA